MPKSSRKSESKRSRRKFLKEVALGAGALAVPGGQAAAVQAAGAGGQGAKSPAQPADRIAYPRVFSGRHRKMLAFPLGGVGAGSISLGGRGELREWWIFNRPDKGNAPNYAFPSIWAQAGNAPPVARVLEARYLPPYEGSSGLGSQNAPGLPRLESSLFTGEFPLARVDFADSDLPVKVSLEAFTPFIPLDADESGLPVAVLRYRVTNPEAQPAQASIAFSIDNPVGTGDATGRSNEFRSAENLSGLLMKNPFLGARDPLAGTFVLGVLGGTSGRLSYLRGWPSATWWQSPLLFWDDFSKDGELGPQTGTAGTVGALCLKREIPGGADAGFTFLLSWHFPNRTPKRCGWRAPEGHENDLISNFYCSRFKDAWDAAQYAAQNLTDLEQRTRQFVETMRETTLPASVKDAATANLSALVTATSFRTSDGSFHAFEGCDDQSGCCFGNCTHVYAYETTIASVFPSLSRSLRDQQFGFLTDDEGRMDYRELLPYGIARTSLPAADGQMACLMKLYWDWRLSGDTEWLRNHWPAAKRALEFAWIKGGWDANRDGVMEGVQHNTYDVEFIGPNPLCGIWYLGALRAGEEMARAVGDDAAATEYHHLFVQGRDWIDAHLFNGEYYVQKIEGIPRDHVAKGMLEGMGGDTEHPTFQVGEGCLADQLMGQYYAQVAGLGPVLDTDNVRATLRSIYKLNYASNLSNHVNVQRTYALNDEAGLLVCHYPEGKRPETPFPYYAEIWTGIEYSTAALMIYEGLVEQGLQIVESARRRFDGERRNAWDEPECGWHYSRPMAAWSPFLALSGFRYHGVEKSVVAKPLVNRSRFSSFWSSGTGWGAFSQQLNPRGITFTLTVHHGSLACKSVALARRNGNGSARASSAKLDNGVIAHELQTHGDEMVFVFSQDVVVTEGHKLLLSA
ncbi:MAG TPA: GH116 family glycosyl-hydrolase [Terriglobia bacterium]|nr:GH116 family glycosyl-hydrolase [Terriglobia bacterium]